MKHVLSVVCIVISLLIVLLMGFFHGVYYTGTRSEVNVTDEGVACIQVFGHVFEHEFE